MSLLNPQQQAVVDAGGGAMLVLAGAGSGKTRTLIGRLERLLRLGVRPETICLLTFTNRAAGEMIERLRTRSGLAAADDIVAGTFHGVAARVLRLEGEAFGYAASATILDAEDARRLMADAYAAHPATFKVTPKRLLRLYSACIQRRETLSQAIERLDPSLSKAEGPIREIFAIYLGDKERFDVLDFDDLLMGWHHILQTRAARGSKSPFEHVLVDEFQDTNRLQADIVALLSQGCGNIVVVGDDSQSIYAFRGADHRVILDFPARFERCRVHKLETNYRSTPQILSLANASIAFNPDQHPKVLTATRPSGDRPVLVSCRDAAEEARFVAQRIEDLHTEGTPLSEIAVLYRAHADAHALQAELAVREVPFSLHSGLPFFEKAHVKDLLALLKLCHNHRDGVAQLRCLCRLPGVGARSVERMRPTIAESQSAREGLTRSLSMLKGRARQSIEGLIVVLSAFSKGCSPGAWLGDVALPFFGPHCVEGRDNPEVRLEDLGAVASYASGFESIGALLTDAALMTGERGRVLVSGQVDEARVCLSTIHKSKGLEWSSVFLIGVAEGRFPRGWGAISSEEMGEARRLFHVAITRARDTLTLSWPRASRARGRSIGQSVSTLIKELMPAGAPLRSTALLEVWRLSQEEA